MATASRHLCRSLLRLSSQPPIRRQCQSIQRHRIQPSPFKRQLSTTRCRYADAPSRQDNAAASGNDNDEEDFDEADLQIPAEPYTTSDLDPEERAHYETLTKPEQTKYLAVQNHVKALMEQSPEMFEPSDGEVETAFREFDRQGLTEELDFREEKNVLAMRGGLWQEDEDDEFGQVPDDDDEYTEDMLTSVAESELEVHREVREYTRRAAWDLPLLLQYARPFELPDMKKQPLRFRYTTYMGESHPAAKKVVVEFTTKDLAGASSLSEKQRIKLIKLAGVRYNPDKDLVHMSCEKFENPAQNKRYLGDLVNDLIKEAKDAKDMFEDVPLDFRHYKPRNVAAFPDSWKIDSQQAAQRLVKQREDVKLLEEGSRVVDGKELLESYVYSKTVQGSMARSM